MSSSVSDAYSVGASAWALGPARLYSRLADELVGFSPLSLDGKLVLDLGSGTGVGARAAARAGARVLATDFALGMLLPDRQDRAASAVGDAQALPFRDTAFDVVLAPFCLNHLDDPASGVREVARVSHALLGSTYATDDHHPVKAAVEQALREHGWVAPSWYGEIKAAMATWGTVDAARAAITRGGMDAIRVEHLDISFDDLGADGMVAWRLGMAACAPFVATLDGGAKGALHRRSVELLGPDPDPVVRRVIFFAARASDRAR